MRVLIFAVKRLLDKHLVEGPKCSLFLQLQQNGVYRTPKNISILIGCFMGTMFIGPNQKLSYLKVFQKVCRTFLGVQTSFFFEYLSNKMLY